MLPYHSPGVRSWNYISYLQSKYHIWFQDMGYPQLDIEQYDDGQWSIIEYLRTPIIPQLTPNRVILAGMKNMEISFGFIERYLDECNPQSARFWANVDAHEKQTDIDFETREANVVDRAERAARYVLKNPELMERIVKNGPHELDLRMIRRHIPNHAFRRA